MNNIGWHLLHVPSALAAYAAFLLAFFGGLAGLAGKNRAPVSGEPDPWDTLTVRAAAAGLFFLTFGILTGSLWAKQAWGRYWSWDPKETWALITWLYYALSLHLRQSHGWRGRPYAWLMVAGLAFVLFTFFGVNYLLGGLHAYL